MARSYNARLTDGQELLAYSVGNTNIGKLKMDASALVLQGTSGKWFAVNPSYASLNMDLKFDGNASIAGVGNSTISLGTSGDTINLNVSGVRYNVGTLTGSPTITGSLTLQGSDLNLGGSTTYLKNGNLDATNSAIVFSRDTDMARIEFVDYGSDADALTFTFGDRSTDFIRFRNDTSGSGNYVNILDLYGDAIWAMKPLNISLSENTPALIVQGSSLGWASGIQFKNTTASTGKTHGIYSGSDGSFNITDESSAANRIKITSSGNVGIGVTSPIFKLDVNGDIHSNQGAFVYQYSDSNNIDHLWHDDTARSSLGGTWHFVSDAPSKAAGNSMLEAGGVYLKGSVDNYIAGNLGIGITSASTKVDIIDPSTTTTLTGTSAYGAIHLRPSNTSDGFTGITSGGQGVGSTQAGILFQSSSTYGTKMHFLTTDSFASGTKNRMTLDNTGKLGINTTAPSQTLDINGSMRLRGNILGYNSTSGRLNIYNNTSSTNSGTWIEMYSMDGTTRQGELTLAGNYIAFRTGSNATVTGSEVMTLKGTELKLATGQVRAKNFIVDGGRLQISNGVDSGIDWSIHAEGESLSIREQEDNDKEYFRINDDGTIDIKPAGTLSGKFYADKKVIFEDEVKTKGLYKMTNLGPAFREGGELNFLGKLSGRILNKNPDFITGGMGGYSTYDNANSGRITRSIVSDDTIPNATGKLMRVSYDPALSTTASSPNYGGFKIGIPRDSSGNLSSWGYKAGNRYVHRILAKIPVGRKIVHGSNTIGSGSVIGTWLTPQDGTGEWQEYIMYQAVGNTGTFSSTGYWSISGGADEAFTWDVASVQIIGLDEVADVDRAPSLNVGYKQGDLGWGELYATGNITTDGALKGASLTVTGAVSAGTIVGSGSLSLTAASSGIELGSSSTAGTPYIDFHSSGTPNDYDVRLISASGTSGTSGRGDFTIGAGNTIIADRLTVNGDLWIPKRGYYSNIVFPKQTNDDGFISHYENNNQATMYFSVSDDPLDNDYFSFGARTPGTNYVEGARITAIGNATFSNTTVADLTSSGVATFNGRVVIPASSGEANALTIGSVTIGQQNANGTELVFTNLSELRFGSATSSSWNWNNWGGIKHISGSDTMVIGGPASSNFSSNTSAPRINLNFEGLSQANFDGGVVIYPTNKTTIGATTITNAWLRVGSNINAIGIDDNEIYSAGSQLNIGTIGGYDIVFQPNGSVAASIKSSGFVGIGTSSPAQKLHVNGWLRVDNDIHVPTSGSLWIGNNADTGNRGRFHYNGTDAYIDVYPGILHLRSNSTDKIIFDLPNARMSIGKTGPTEALDVVGNIVNTGNITAGSDMVITGGSKLSFSSYGGGWYMQDASWIRTVGGKSIYSAGGTIRTDSRLEVGSSSQLAVTPTSFNFRDTIWSDGTKVGIGAAKASHPLQVTTGLTHQGINIQRTDDLLQVGLSFQNSGGAYTWHVANNAVASSDLVFSGNGTNSTLSSLGENARMYNNGDFRIRGHLMVDRSSVDQNPAISIAIGDNDTGFNWVSDGVFTVYNNNSEKVRFNTSNVTFNHSIIMNDNIGLNSSNGRGLRFWNSDTYKIYMSASNDSSWGGNISGAPSTADYNMYFKMGGGATRGFAFKNESTIVAQVDGDGKVHSKGGFRNGNFEIVHNSSEDSLDFVYVG